MQIHLTREQWAAFGREDERHHDPKLSALQSCCANISALRDVILQLAEHDGEFVTTSLDDLAKKWEWCRAGHTFDDVTYPSWKTLRSLIEQAGLPPCKSWR